MKGTATPALPPTASFSASDEENSDNTGRLEYRAAVGLEDDTAARSPELLNVIVDVAGDLATISRAVLVEDLLPAMGLDMEEKLPTDKGEGASWPDKISDRDVSLWDSPTSLDTELGVVLPAGSDI